MEDEMKLGFYKDVHDTGVPTKAVYKWRCRFLLPAAIDPLPL